jgi:hypothetical protein
MVALAGWPPKFVMSDTVLTVLTVLTVVTVVTVVTVPELIATRTLFADLSTQDGLAIALKMFRRAT